jgi:hypothetical protein
MSGVEDSIEESSERTIAATAVTGAVQAKVAMMSSQAVVAKLDELHRDVASIGQAIVEGVVRDYREKHLEWMSEMSSKVSDIVESLQIISGKRKLEDVYPNLSNAEKVGLGSEFNFTEYFNIVKKRSSGGGMLGMVGDMIASNPLGFAMTMGITALMPQVFKTSMEKIGKTFRDLPSLITMKLNEFKNSSNPVLSWIGEKFGISPGASDAVSLGNYEKGAVPFDGYTRRAIVNVIPDLLSKILAAVSGTEELVYDYEQGRFIQKSVLVAKAREDMVGSTTRNITDGIKGLDDKQKSMLQDALINQRRTGTIYRGGELKGLDPETSKIFSEFWQSKSLDERRELTMGLIEDEIKRNRLTSDISAGRGTTSSGIDANALAQILGSDNVQSAYGDVKVKFAGVGAGGGVGEFGSSPIIDIRSMLAVLVDKIAGTSYSKSLSDAFTKKQSEKAASPDTANKTDNDKDNLSAVQNANTKFLRNPLAWAGEKIDAVNRKVLGYFFGPEEIDKKTGEPKPGKARGFFDKISSKMFGDGKTDRGVFGAVKDWFKDNFGDVKDAEGKTVSKGLVSRMSEAWTTYFVRPFRDTFFGKTNPDGTVQTRGLIAKFSDTVFKPTKDFITDMFSRTKNGAGGLYGSLIKYMGGKEGEPLGRVFGRYMFGDTAPDGTPIVKGVVNPESVAKAKAAGIGGLVGLLVGSPLLGAGLGWFTQTETGKNLVSDTKTYLFGKTAKDGEPEVKGVISPEIIGKAKGFGIGGVVGSILGMPLIGAMLGLGLQTEQGKKFIGSVKSYIFGSTAADVEAGKEGDAIKPRGLKPETRSALAKIGVGGALGYIVGGGILGGAVGAFLGSPLVDTIKTYLFGKTGKNGQPDVKGVVSPVLQRKLAGTGVGGALGYMLGGPYMALVGSVTGWATQSEAVRKTLFGDAKDPSKRGLFGRLIDGATSVLDNIFGGLRRLFFGKDAEKNEKVIKTEVEKSGGLVPQIISATTSETSLEGETANRLVDKLKGVGGFLKRKSLSASQAASAVIERGRNFAGKAFQLPIGDSPVIDSITPKIIPATTEKLSQSTSSMGSLLTSPSTTAIGESFESITRKLSQLTSSIGSFFTLPSSFTIGENLEGINEKLSQLTSSIGSLFTSPTSFTIGESFEGINEKLSQLTSSIGSLFTSPTSFTIGESLEGINEKLSFITPSVSSFDFAEVSPAVSSISTSVDAIRTSSIFTIEFDNVPDDIRAIRNIVENNLGSPSKAKLEREPGRIGRLFGKLGLGGLIDRASRLRDGLFSWLSGTDPASFMSPIVSIIGKTKNILRDTFVGSTALLWQLFSGTDGRPGLVRRALGLGRDVASGLFIGMSRLYNTILQRRERASEEREKREGPGILGRIFGLARRAGSGILGMFRRGEKSVGEQSETERATGLLSFLGRLPGMGIDGLSSLFRGIAKSSGLLGRVAKSIGGGLGRAAGWLGGGARKIGETVGLIKPKKAPTEVVVVDTKTKTPIPVDIVKQTLEKLNIQGQSSSSPDGPIDTSTIQGQQAARAQSRSKARAEALNQKLFKIQKTTAENTGGLLKNTVKFGNMIWLAMTTGLKALFTKMLIPPILTGIALLKTIAFKGFSFGKGLLRGGKGAKAGLAGLGVLGAGGATAGVVGTGGAAAAGAGVLGAGSAAVAGGAGAVGAAAGAAGAGTAGAAAKSGVLARLTGFAKNFLNSKVMTKLGGPKLIPILGKMTPVLSKIGAGTLMRAVARFAGPVGLAITTALAGKAAWDGWRNASDTYGVDPGIPMTATEKGISSLGHVLSSLVFGLIPPSAFVNPLAKAMGLGQYRKMSSQDSPSTGAIQSQNATSAVGDIGKEQDDSASINKESTALRIIKFMSGYTTAKYLYSQVKKLGGVKGVGERISKLVKFMSGYTAAKYLYSQAKKLGGSEKLQNMGKTVFEHMTGVTAYRRLKSIYKKFGGEEKLKSISTTVLENMTGVTAYRQINSVIKKLGGVKGIGERISKLVKFMSGGTLLSIIGSRLFGARGAKLSSSAEALSIDKKDPLFQYNKRMEPLIKSSTSTDRPVVTTSKNVKLAVDANKPTTNKAEEASVKSMVDYSKPGIKGLFTADLIAEVKTQTGMLTDIRDLVGAIRQGVGVIAQATSTTAIASSKTVAASSQMPSMPVDMNYLAMGM